MNRRHFLVLGAGVVVAHWLDACSSAHQHNQAQAIIAIDLQKQRGMFFTDQWFEFEVSPHVFAIPKEKAMDLIFV